MTKKLQILKPTLAVFLGLLVGLILCEVGLRYLRPEYAYQAQAMTHLDHQLFLVRPAHSKTSYPHPDRDEEIAIFYDRYGLRVGRPGERKDRITEKQKLWGFFGDSFTENLRIPYNELFTTHIQNALAQGDLPRVDVLNFGVEGYGTDQSYLNYKRFEHKDQLEKIIYLFHHNDLQDVLYNQLYSLEGGRLVPYLKSEVSYIKRFLGQFYLTYFALDCYYQLKGRSLDDFFTSQAKDDFIPLLALKELKKIDEKRKSTSWGMDEAMTDDNIELVHEIIELWQDEAKRANSDFVLVVLPDRKSNFIAREVFKDQEDILYSRSAFLEAFKDPTGQSWSFKNDDHWNEKAQKVFAQWLLPHLLSH